MATCVVKAVDIVNGANEVSGVDVSCQHFELCIEFNLNL